jgi:hypothetical protein
VSAGKVETVAAFVYSLLVMLRHKSEAVQADKIAEEVVDGQARQHGGAHRVSDELVGRGRGVCDSWCCLVWVDWIHGTDLTQSWVSTAGTLLRLSNTSIDRGMVLLEQAWVFWLGDNL